MQPPGYPSKQLYARWAPSCPRLGLLLGPSAIEGSWAACLPRRLSPQSGSWISCGRRPPASSQHWAALLSLGLRLVCSALPPRRPAMLTLVAHRSGPLGSPSRPSQLPLRPPSARRQDSAGAFSPPLDLSGFSPQFRRFRQFLGLLARATPRCPVRAAQLRQRSARPDQDPPRPIGRPPRPQRATGAALSPPVSGSVTPPICSGLPSTPVRGCRACSFAYRDHSVRICAAITGLHASGPARLGFLLYF